MVGNSVIEAGMLLTRGGRKNAGQLKQHVFAILQSRAVGEMKCSKKYEMFET